MMLNPEGMHWALLAVLAFVAICCCIYAINHVWQTQDVIKRDLKYMATQEFVRSYTHDIVTGREARSHETTKPSQQTYRPPPAAH